MNQPDPFDRLVADWLQEGAYEAPEEAVLAATQHALRHPRVPDPFAFLRKDAMNSSRSILGLPPLVAAAILVLLLAVVAAAAGGLFRNTVAVVTNPTPGPSAVALASPTVASTPAPAPAATPAGSQAPYIRPAEPGTPIPDSMLGTWFDTSQKSFPWFLRAGDPYCVQVVSTNQDCMAWDLGNGRVTYGGTLTILGDTLAIRYLNGSGCQNSQGKYSYSLSATKLVLTWVGGNCQSGDYAFERAGTGTTPTAPPQPGP
jgi:hypothetical protein